jgi:CDP-glycerol glycerophosphotransferase
MIASDLLISDYSSIFFDYSILEKPMFHFTYDYDRYNKERGLYFDIREQIDGSSIEDELINKIKKLNKSKNIESVIKFRNKYVEVYGNATTSSLDIIYTKIKD